MRFPSLQSLTGSAWRTFRRFPIAILLAAKATGLGIWWTHLKERPQDYTGSAGAGWHTTIIEVPQWYWNAIVSCYLGVLLSVAMTKFVEKRGGGRGLGIGLQAAVVVLAGLYYWSLPPEPSVIMVTRTMVLALALHWLIAVIGYGRNEVNGFWVFNKRLFLRALTTI